MFHELSAVQEQCKEAFVMMAASQLLARLLLLQQLISCLYSIPTSAAAGVGDKLERGQNFTDGETLVSAGGSYTLGFFSPGLSTKRYLGIWFSVSNNTVYWVANRDQPLPDKSGMLVFNDVDSLVLLDGYGRTAWSSNFLAASAAVVQLLESGNLVVRNGSSDISLWQSFDQPSDTLLPGMKLGKNLWTGGEWQLTSWSSPTDPSPGLYRRSLETKVLPETAVWRAGVKTYRTGPWNGLYFNGVPEMVSYANFYTYQLTVSPAEVTYGYETKAGAPLSRIIMTDAGMLQRLAWDRSSRSWETFYSAPRDGCDEYARCGAFGLCDAGAGSTSFCRCIKGFTPVSPSAWGMRDTSGGCHRSVALDCGTSTSSTDGFAVESGVRLPDTQNATVDAGIGLEECRERCLANCSCVAYAAADIRGGDGAGHGCIIWSGNIVDVRYQDRGQDLYHRLAKSELVVVEDHANNAKARKMKIAIIATVCATVCAAVFICLTFVIWRNMRRKIVRDARIVHINNDAARVRVEAGNMPLNATAVASVDLATLHKATRNFSTRNVIGEGAFGIVYEGQLPKDHPLVEGLPGRKVAVKRLKLSLSLPNRALSDYTREVEVVCNLRHDNLVRLLAYCDDGDERILVYEYVQNKSLDLYIFGKPSNRASLNWAKRLEIIRGIAQGVCYLHDGSGANVVHRDLKPSNMLLDHQWRPKIADFGTAKLFRDDLTGTQTVVVSPGYASPEYAKEGEMTPKCDVFSFGVVLLEIISGHRNSAAPSVISQAWRLWEEHRVMDLLDAALPAPARRHSGSDELSSELRRCIHIGLLCVQQSPGSRPAMSAVLAMLGSKDMLLEQPKGPAQQRGPTSYGCMSLDLEQSTVVNLT